MTTPTPATPSSVTRWRGWIMLAALVVGVALVLALQGGSARPVSEHEHLSAWGAAVRRALASPGSGCNASRVYGVTRLTGFGSVSEVCVNRGTGANSYEVTFEAASGPTGLAFTKDFPLPYDQCSEALGHGWYALVAVGPSTTTCPHGDTMDPRP